MRSIKQYTALCLLLALALFLSGNPALADDYSAAIAYSEKSGPTQIVGRAAVSGPNALLEIDMGEAGLASFWILRDQCKVYVAAHSLQTYAVFDFQADYRNFPDLLSKMATAAMPLDLPILAFREERTVSAGSEVWQNEVLDVQRCKYYLDFMNTAWQVEFFLWQPERLWPFPLKLDGIRSFSDHPADYESIGPLIELVDIAFGPQNPAQFEPPLHYRQMYSLVDLMFFALIPHLNLR